MPSVSQLRRGGDDERAALIRHMVDDVCQRIENDRLGESAARSLAGDVRFFVSLLIPDRMELFDRIYGSRFDRLIDQFIRGEP